MYYVLLCMYMVMLLQLLRYVVYSSVHTSIVQDGPV